MNISVDDVADVFPRPLLDEERSRVGALIEQSYELIELEFARRGRDFQSEVADSRWLQLAAKQAVRAWCFRRSSLATMWVLRRRRRLRARSPIR